MKYNLLRTRKTYIIFWGVRYQVFADSSPFFHQMQVYIVLSSTYEGTFPGYIRVVCPLDAWSEALLFEADLEPQPQFPEGGAYFSYVVPISVGFPESGVYWVQILFGPTADSAHVKMEKPFFVNQREEYIE